MGEPMNTALAVTIAIFAAGVIFGAGRLTSRVESLESWRAEVRGDLTQIRADIASILKLIKGGVV
jgi:hypothetical protein